MKTHLEKIGIFGAIAAAAACPICFPKLALVGALFGLGALGAYESQLFLAAQVLIAVAVLGHVLAYWQHRKRWLLGLAIASGAAVFGGLYALHSEAVTYAGFVGLVVASATDFWGRYRRETPSSLEDAAAPERVLESVITCPTCNYSRRETMPTGACQFFYDCPGCGALLRPKAGDCCVFCSYGSAKCPPTQAAGVT